MKHPKDKIIKVMIVAGARPNFVKIAPLFCEFKRHPEIKPILVHTGQHYDFEMSQVFFQDLDIPKPDYNLGVGSGSHAIQTAQVMVKIEKVFEKEKPDIVFVIGDVNSTVAAALVASKLHISIAHLEAGPRMFDKTMPEEVNRVLVDHISDFNFCPTKISVNNLKNEGILRGVYFTGDTMFDSFLHVLARVGQKEKLLLQKYSLEQGGYLLLTLHRPVNVDNGQKLKKILQTIIKTGENIIFPTHPRVKKQIKMIFDSLCDLENFNSMRFIDPVGYSEMVILEKNSKKICTDSGGIQKEAYWLKLPCITLMETTGWPETNRDGWNIPVGSDRKKITNAIKNFNPRGRQSAYFGKGDASKKIIEIIKHQL
jgi:UDP-N-acetylglucosamine 2-epimerase (non-hydrolysing)